MKKSLLILFSFLLLVGCGENEEANSLGENSDSFEEKRNEMLDTAVSMYMNQMTLTLSNAYTIAVTKEDKQKYLNEAITDINLAVLEIEEEYEPNAQPVGDLLKLADWLLSAIDHEIVGDSEDAYDAMYEAGKIIGELSREYLDGELPPGVKLMTGKENAHD